MSLSRERAVRLEAETGFRSDVLEKVVRLGEFLGDIRRHPILSRALALKGGTALNLKLETPPRLSVDLDFNYIASADLQTMQQDRATVERAVEALATSTGYQVQRSRDEHASRKLYLTYVNSQATRDRIEVDLNFLHRLPLREPIVSSLWQPADFPRPEVRLVAIEEICAGKFCALLDRALPRDLYDSTQLPRLAAGAWETPALRSLVVGMAGTLAHPLHSYGRHSLERVTRRRLEDELFPLLTVTDRPTVDELKEKAWQVVGPFLRLSDSEREYTDRLQEGELVPDFYFQMTIQRPICCGGIPLCFGRRRMRGHIGAAHRLLEGEPAPRSAQKAWRGQAGNVAAAQKAYYLRAKLNGRRGPDS